MSSSRSARVTNSGERHRPRCPIPRIADDADQLPNSPVFEPLQPKTKVCSSDMNVCDDQQDQLIHRVAVHFRLCFPLVVHVPANITEMAAVIR